METLLAEELATEKMRYTLELKDKRVKETELDARAEKVRREIGAEAAAREQVIAAKAQEEAMKHVLPFKQRQIEQRQLEAEAAKVTRIKAAEASAQSRRIEAGGEAEARQRLADAEVYRMERVGQAGAEQMSREGALLTRHPLLIQKALADKLSDKIQVIIAAPPADGSFIGASLLGGANSARVAGGGDEQHADSTAAIGKRRDAVRVSFGRRDRVVASLAAGRPAGRRGARRDVAIVLRDQTPARARATAPRTPCSGGESSRCGRALDHLQVGDHARERGGSSVPAR